MAEKKEKKIDWKSVAIKLGVTALIIAAVIVGGYFLMDRFGLIGLTKEELQEFVAGTGAWAPAVFIFVSFLQVSFVPIPGAVTIVAGNYLFGFWQSFLYSYLGMMIGSILAFALGKFIGRPFVNWIAGDKETVDYYLEKLRGRENVVLFFMFLLPFFPDDILCSIAGIMPLGWVGFIIMQVITRATSILATLLFMSGELIPYTGWGIPVLITLGILAVIAFIISFKYSDKINDWFVSLFKRKDSQPSDSVESSSGAAEETSGETAPGSDESAG